jgi:5-methylcytosine-specific restriction endonuclease McrA
MSQISIFDSSGGTVATGCSEHAFGGFSGERPRIREQMPMDAEGFLKRNRAIDLVAEATGGDSYHIERLAARDEISRDDVVEQLREAHVPLVTQLLADVDRVFAGSEPCYFVQPEVLVERYRQRYHSESSFTEPDYRLEPLSCSDVAQELEKVISECQLYGVSLDEYRDGAACVAEQRFFYETEEWEGRATVVRIMDHFACRACNQQGAGEMLPVHHSELIYSAFSRHFYRNFDTIRLRSLCDSCHRGFHSTHVRGYSDFRLASAEQVEGNWRCRRTLEGLHDAMKECQFCFPETRKAA